MSTITGRLPSKINLEKVTIVTFFVGHLLVKHDHWFVDSTIFEYRPRAACIVIALLEALGPDVFEPKTSHVTWVEVSYVRFLFWTGALLPGKHCSWEKSESLKHYFI